jgi:hypothetical protein
VVADRRYVFGLLRDGGLGAEPPGEGVGQDRRAWPRGRLPPIKHTGIISLPETV